MKALLFANCSGQNLTRTRLMTRVQTIEGFPQNIHNYQNSYRSLRHIQPFWSCPPSRRYFRSGAAFRNLKDFTTMRLLPLQSPHLLRVFSTPRPSLFSEDSTSDLKLQQQIILDLHRLCNSFLPHVYNM